MTVSLASGWQESFQFTFTDTLELDPLTGCVAACMLTSPRAAPFALDAEVQGSLVVVTVPRGAPGLAPDTYTLELRVFDPQGVVDRYVITGRMNVER